MKTKETDSQTPQKESQKTKNRVARDQVHPLQQNETNGKSRYRQSRQEAEARSALLQLNRITEVLQAESKVYPDCLPTSFVAVETELATRISECLADFPLQSRNIPYVEYLLRDYEVMKFVPGQNPSVSLQRVHTILADNFPSSSLCYLLNILLMGHNGLQTKVITFM